MHPSDLPSELDDARAVLRDRARVARDHARTLTRRSLELGAASGKLINAMSATIDDATRFRDTVAPSGTDRKQLSEELQEAVVQHALAMHALGAQPERVIVEMGQVLDEVSAEAFASTQRSTVWVDANALRASVVRWSLDTYFGVGG